MKLAESVYGIIEKEKHFLEMQAQHLSKAARWKSEKLATQKTP